LGLQRYFLIGRVKANYEDGPGGNIRAILRNCHRW